MVILSALSYTVFTSNKYARLFYDGNDDVLWNSVEFLQAMIYCGLLNAPIRG